MSKSGIPIVSDVAKAVKPIVQPIAKAIRPLAPILPFIPIPGMFGLSSLLTRSLLTGALGGLDKQGKFNVGRGVKSGLLAYGIGSLMPSTATAGTSGTPGISGFADAADEVGGALSGGISSGMPVSAPDISVTPISAAPDISTMPVSNTMTAAQMDPSILRNLPAEATAAGPVSTAGPTAIKAAISEPTAADVINKALEPSYLDKLGNYASALPGKALDYAVKNPIQAALGATTAYGAISSKQELDRQKEEAERIVRNREREKAENVARAEGFLRDYPLLYKRFTAEDVQRMGLASGGMTDPDSDDRDKYEMGGLASLAAGGMPPRYLRGGGDGMSDSIPARIGEKQEARLADGEFVVPADVVSHIGNGSSNAGAKKLYAMMDRVRQARTGKTRQAPAVNMRRMMPV